METHKKQTQALELCQPLGFHNQPSSSHNFNHHTQSHLREWIKIRKKSREVLGIWMTVQETIPVTQIVWWTKDSWEMLFTTHESWWSQTCKMWLNLKRYTLTIQDRPTTHSTHLVPVTRTLETNSIKIQLIMIKVWRKLVEVQFNTPNYSIRNCMMLEWTLLIQDPRTLLNNLIVFSMTTLRIFPNQFSPLEFTIFQRKAVC